MYYMGKAHQFRFARAVKKNTHKCPKDYLAVLYLLSADHDLWLNTITIREDKTINFAVASVQDMTAEQYTLFKAAQDIYTGSVYISLQDLCDYYAIPDQLANAILEAVRIARKGYPHIGIKKPFN
jgi:hypothetical protein